MLWLLCECNILSISNLDCILAVLWYVIHKRHTVLVCVQVDCRSQWGPVRREWTATSTAESASTSASTSTPTSVWLSSWMVSPLHNSFYCTTYYTYYPFPFFFAIVSFPYKGLFCFVLFLKIVSCRMFYPNSSREWITKTYLVVPLQKQIATYTYICIQLPLLTCV